MPGVGAALADSSAQEGEWRWFEGAHALREAELGDASEEGGQWLWVPKELPCGSSGDGITENVLNTVNASAIGGCDRYANACDGSWAYSTSVARADPSTSSSSSATLSTAVTPVVHGWSQPSFWTWFSQLRAHHYSQQQPPHEDVSSATYSTRWRYWRPVPLLSDGSLADFSVLAAAPRALIGLRNLGNSCFLSAVLQCCSNTPVLVALLLQRRALSDVAVSKAASAPSLATSLGRLAEPRI
jgi:hypothetical protein